MIRTTTGRRAAVLLLGASVIAAACGSSSSSSKTDAPTTTAAAGADTTAAPVATDAPTTTAAAPAGGTITIALPDVFTSYNNGTADDSLFSNQLLLNPVQGAASYFTAKGGKITLNANLIDSAEVTSKDPQVITYKINDKAVWSDGKPIDGSDFYLAWISNNGKVQDKDADGNLAPIFATASTSGYEQVKSVETSADGKTVTVTYDSPFTDWLSLFSLLLPNHVLEAQTGTNVVKAYEAATAATPDLTDIKKVAEFWNTGWKTDKGLNKDTMLSAGPYAITDYVADQSVTLERNPAWWGAPAQADQLVYRIIIEDTAAAQALQNGEVDVIMPQPDPDLLNQLKGISSVKTNTSGGFTFEHFDLNLKNPLLADIAVRTAIAHCLPRQEIIDKLIKPINPDAKLVNSRMYLPLQPDYKDQSGGLYDAVDIPAAKAALEAAGYKLSGSVYAKDGKKLEFKFLHKKNARRQAEFELTQASCAQAGISFLDDGDDKWSTRAGNSDYDVAIFAWIGSDLLSPQKSIYGTGGGQNWNNYSNADVDKNLDVLNTNLDSTTWPAAANAVDAQLWKDLVTFPIFQFVDVQAWKDTITGPEYNPTQQGLTWNVQDWVVSK